jgi:peptidoglycan hydrolase-like protein with peptidoglycan-binding domain
MKILNTFLASIAFPALLVACGSGDSSATTTTSPATTTTVAEIVAQPVNCGDKYVFNEELPLKPCDQGMGIESVQSQLLGAGFQVDLDGYYGQGTETAVRQYQASRGLPVTGIVDFETYKKLGTYYAGTDMNGDGVITPNEFILD